MLIPPKFDDTSSIGERLVFYKFRNDKQTDAYYVLHSLFISKHLKNISGEIDFLVLVPGQGIFCLEVKHGRVSREGGVWIFENKSGQKTTSTKGPFRQVSDNMHSLRNWLISNSANRPELQNRIKKLLFGWGVLFTSLDYFSDYGSEAEPWQICTKQFTQIPISNFILSLSRGWHNKFTSQSWYDVVESRPNGQDCQNILRLLRGDFKYDYRGINRITDQETIIAEFTREQFDVLNFTSYNDRCMIEGPAGTGKTVLAEELFSRKIRDGKRTAFLCYNNLLGQKIAHNAEALAPEAGTPYYAGTLHGYMVRITGSQIEEDHQYFSEMLPLEFLMHVDELPENVKFDYLIIDESQDLLTENYLDVLDAMLKGGLQNGAWCCFGDFSGQAIFLNDPGAAIAALSRRATFMRHPTLQINCRNTRRIADQNTLLTGMIRPKSNTSLLEGEPVDAYFVSREAIASKIEEVVRELLNQKIPLGKITILSAHRWESSYLDCQYLNQKRKEGLDFHTVHSFKGLENSIIILTGFTNLSDDSFRRLLYVGISRARIKLYLIFEKDQKLIYDTLIATNYTLLKS